MLIIKIKSNEDEKINGRFFKKQLRPDAFKRSCFNIRNKPCTLIEFNETMLPTLNLERLFKTFEGRIIGAADDLEKVVPPEYRFDIKPYYKRALLSSLRKNISSNARSLNLAIKDDNFVFSQEYINLAKSVKSFTLLTKESTETDRFCNHCFVEYGFFVNIVNSYDNIVNCNIYVDFNKIEHDGKIMIVKDEREAVLYPDPEFFAVDDEIRPVLKMGIPLKVVCAAFDSK